MGRDEIKQTSESEETGRSFPDLPRVRVRRTERETYGRVVRRVRVDLRRLRV